MYLSSEQRYNIAMRMLGIVEHMAFGRQQPVALSVPAKPPRDDTDEHDDELNAIIREQLRVGTELIDEENANG